MTLEGGMLIVSSCKSIASKVNWHPAEICLMVVHKFQMLKA